MGLRTDLVVVEKIKPLFLPGIEPRLFRRPFLNLVAKLNTLPWLLYQKDISGRNLTTSQLLEEFHLLETETPLPCQNFITLYVMLTFHTLLKTAHYLILY
jgi:hypothetical protein